MEGTGLQDNKKVDARIVERYRKRTVVLHWLHAAAFLVLAATGAVTFFQTTGYSNFYFAKVLHRIAAIIFIVVPVINYLVNPRGTAGFIKEAFKWGRDDLKWFLAAPDYYFGGSGERMPPQGHINAGQKVWQLVIMGTGLVFIGTGIALWGFRSELALPVYKWLLLVHGAAFIIVILMFLVHISLGVFHPRFRESLPSMLNGKISIGYAKAHYRKWYEQNHQDKR
jgi:formate dehydrogenase subunit gamma